MTNTKLRDAIAVEAARLILRHKETNYSAARKRAARWLSRKRLSADEMPTNAEVENQLYALKGLFTAERQDASLRGMREMALELMQVLRAFRPRLFGCAVDGPVMIGSEIQIAIEAGTVDEVLDVLRKRGFSPHVILERETFEDETDELWGSFGANLQARLKLYHRFPCEVRVVTPSILPETQNESREAEPGSGIQEEGTDAQELERLIEKSNEHEVLADEKTIPTYVPEDGYHPDTFSVLQMLLERLEKVQLPPDRHPEGDALYHSLQVYELGLAENPYDEEFLLACLLHEVGMGIDRRNPVQAAVEALQGLVTERTIFLIERRPEAREYLKTGKISRSLRRSEHFEELLLLARCDRDGRVPGAEVPTVEEALQYIGGMSTAWDDV